MAVTRMSRQFSFLTGFPRSRTCWMAELLTVHGHSFAFHEAGSPVLGIEKWREKLESRPEQHVIDCSCAPLIHFGEEAFTAAFAGCKIYLIEREVKEAWKSYEAFLVEGKITLSMEQKNAVWVKMTDNMIQLRRGVPTIQFPDLDDADKVRGFCETIAPGFPWDQQRFEELLNRKVTQNIKRIMENSHA
jgi:hypothetical protein